MIVFPNEEWLSCQKFLVCPQSLFSTIEANTPIFHIPSAHHIMLVSFSSDEKYTRTLLIRNDWDG